MDTNNLTLKACFSNKKYILQSKRTRHNSQIVKVYFLMKNKIFSGDLKIIKDILPPHTRISNLLCLTYILYIIFSIEKSDTKKDDIILNNWDIRITCFGITRDNCMITNTRITA